MLTYYHHYHHGHCYGMLINIELLNIDSSGEEEIEFLRDIGKVMFTPLPSSSLDILIEM